MEDSIREAARIITEAAYFSAFTGAGISVESGIPPFRGENGLWKRYDPGLFEISYFVSHPGESWELMKKLFYDTFRSARPNEAHEVLARLEKKGVLKLLITQNIDSLHHAAGSRNIIEYHGSTRFLICMDCRKKQKTTEEKIEGPLPRCRCGGVLKPDIVFFGEEIPFSAVIGVQMAIETTDVMLVVGTTGEVFPASSIPQEAKANGAKIIEVNTEPSGFTSRTTDVYLRGPAAAVMLSLEKEIERLS
jgi:NAD-dependent deacetylase